jgi:L-threonylcarbamoyladenylate synthase
LTILKVDPRSPDASLIARAAEAILAGEPVAFPTETVYGLGADALSCQAVERIYAAKGRPPNNPLIVHVADAEAARALVTHWPDSATALAKAFWPGPLTLVLPKSERIPDLVTAGLPTVAIRVPAHPVALALLRAAGVPIAAPSANRSNEISPTTAEHVSKSLGDRVGLILDAGPTDIGIESTVLGLWGPTPVLLRPGSLSIARLEALVGPIDRAGPEGSPSVAQRSPGLGERHYAPKAEVILFGEAERTAVLTRFAELHAQGRRAAALVLTATDEPELDARLMPAEPAGYARALYSALHALDDLNYDVIFIERVPDDPAWDGVRDRLERSARR